MNKKIIWVILAIAAAVLIYFLVTGNGQIPLSQESKPATLPSSGSSSGTGIGVQFYNCPPSILSQYNNTGVVPLNVEQTYCTPVVIPSNFASGASIVPMNGGFSIVTRQIPQTCTTVSNCPSAPNMQCYNSQCVLGQVNTINLNISVLNPSASQVTFTSVSPTSVSPSTWSTALGTMAAQTLSPGQSYTWAPSGGLITTSFQGTNTTFSTTISGTNAYTGAVVTASSSVVLQILQDPSGSLSVVVNSPI